MSKYKCQICKDMFDGSDTYEYRGFTFCQPHFEQGQERVNEQRSFVMETTSKSVHSQRVGAFVNDKTGKLPIASDGLPIIKVNEPLALQEYEKGNL